MAAQYNGVLNQDNPQLIQQGLQQLQLSAPTAPNPSPEQVAQQIPDIPPIQLADQPYTTGMSITDNILMARSKIQAISPDATFQRSAIEPAITMAVQRRPQLGHISVLPIISGN